MITGYILIRLTPGFEANALSALRSLPGVVEVEMVFGHWDAVIKVEAKNMHELTRKIIGDLRGIQGIGESETLIATSM